MQSPEIVPCPGSFNLHSRVVRLHTGSSYRDIAVHEMTESEIESLKTMKWVYAAYGFMAGAIPTFIYFASAIHALCASN